MTGEVTRGGTGSGCDTGCTGGGCAITDMARSPESAGGAGVFGPVVVDPVVPPAPRPPPVLDVPPVGPLLEPVVFDAVLVFPELELPELSPVPLPVEPPGLGASGLIWLNIEPPVSVPCTVVGPLSDAADPTGPVGAGVTATTGTGMGATNTGSGGGGAKLIGAGGGGGMSAAMAPLGGSLVIVPPPMICAVPLKFRKS